MKFSAVDTPDACLLDVVIASASLPPAFVPVSIDNNFHADGGILIDIANLKDETIKYSNTLIFAVSSASQIKTIDSVLSYMLRVIDTILKNQSKKDNIDSDTTRHIVYIEFEDINIFDLNLDDLVKKKMILKGMEATDQFLLKDDFEEYVLFKSISTQTDFV